MPQNVLQAAMGQASLAEGRVREGTGKTTQSQQVSAHCKPPSVGVCIRLQLVNQGAAKSQVTLLYAYETAVAMAHHPPMLSGLLLAQHAGATSSVHQTSQS